MKGSKMKKSVWIPLAFVIYSMVIYAYFIPRSEATSTTIALTVVFNVLIIVALWWVYRRKEKLAAEREKDLRDSQDKP